MSRYVYFPSTPRTRGDGVMKKTVYFETLLFFSISKTSSSWSHCCWSVDSAVVPFPHFFIWLGVRSTSPDRLDIHLDEDEIIVKYCWCVHTCGQGLSRAFSNWNCISALRTSLRRSEKKKTSHLRRKTSHKIFKSATSGPDRSRFHVSSSSVKSLPLAADFHHQFINFHELFIRSRLALAKGKGVYDEM